MEETLFAGCLVTYRFPEYELSGKRVLEAIGIKTRIIPGMICCGQVVQGLNSNWIYMAAYNLALAEQRNMDIITLCGGCTNTFKRLQFMCRQKPGLMDDINQVLSRAGLHFQNQVKVRHILQVLNQKSDEIKNCTNSPIPLKIALTNPCQLFRPAEVMDFDDAEHPLVMKNLLNPVVKEIVPYSMQDNCCGASLLMNNPEGAYQAGKARLKELEKGNIDLIITACGNCHLLLHCLQARYYEGRRIPGMFITQLLGIAMGFKPDELMINDQHLRGLVEGV